MTSTRVTVSTGPGPSGTAGDGRYRWVALSNTTLGVLMATLDASIVIISMPAIFRGIHLDPFAPGNISYLLWLILGYLLVTAALVVALGRLGDLYGRVRMYNLGFAIFSGASLALSLDPLTGPGGGLLAAVDWRAVFWINVPIGIVGTVWSYRSLRETSSRRSARIDWAGTLTFSADGDVRPARATPADLPVGGRPADPRPSPGSRGDGVARARPGRPR